MLKKRIIPCLDIKDGRTVKGQSFVNLVDAGDPIELACQYAEQGADELVFLDITATNEKRKTLSELVKKIAQKINIPFTVGGGISSVEDAAALFKSGADKITVNSAAVQRPDLIREITQRFGNQCLVLAIDSKRMDDDWIVHTHGGKKPTNLRVLDWAKQAEHLGAGEILLTSMNNDGNKHGFDIAQLKELTTQVNIPVIASGGAGIKDHFKEVFTKTKVTGALAASVFHFNTITIPELKNYLKQNNLSVR